MDIYKTYAFLVEDYGLQYAFQKFDIGGGWIISAHSFYNDTGCFTVHTMLSRGELEFYYAKHFSTNKSELYEQGLNIYAYEKNIWKKHERLWGFIPNIFVMFNNEKHLEISAEVVKAQINKYGEFFGVKVQNIRGRQH